MTAENSPKLRCRSIADADLDDVATLLDEGFPGRGLMFWQKGLARMAVRNLPAGSPRYGYGLEADGQLVGAILLIAGERVVAGALQPFTNVAAWYVRQEFRSHAQFLVSMALKHKNVSYFNVTAAPHTWPIVEKQGYRKYSEGLFFALAPLVAPKAGVEIIDINANPEHPILGTLGDGDLLRRHADWGCRVIVVRDGQEATGIVLRRLTARAGHIKLPALLVLHATNRDRMIALAGNLGRYFVKEWAPFLAFDANERVPGLPGLFTTRRGRKYVKGPFAPQLCGLADTELAVFGV